MNRPKHILILVENLPLPFDRRVWQEACGAARRWIPGVGDLPDAQGVYAGI